MKHGSNPRRGRNRGNGKRNASPRSHTYESNGPDGKVRGTAQQVLDKYLALGRDAQSSGDPISAEGYYQHAEHYHRLLHASEAGGGDRSQDRARRVTVVSEPAEPAVEGKVLEPATAEAPTESAEPVTY